QPNPAPAEPSDERAESDAVQQHSPPAPAEGIAPEKPAQPPSHAGNASEPVGQNEATPGLAQEPEKQEIVISIYGEGEVGTILEDTALAWEDGASALSVLKQVTRDNRIVMEYRGGSGALAYVEGIDNVYEFDYGPESGWMYVVNGKEPNESAGAYKLQPGDKVEWIYLMSKKER